MIFRFLVPGWRLGWVVVHDRNNALGKEVNCLKLRYLLSHAERKAVGNKIVTHCFLSSDSRLVRTLKNSKQRWRDDGCCKINDINKKKIPQ